MKKRKTVSIILSVIFGAGGILFVYTFLSGENRSIIELIIGICLLFLSIYNMVLTMKFSKD